MRALKFILILFAIHIGNATKAQFEHFGINQDSIHPSALLDISSTSQGLLSPKLSLNERDAILNPAEGLLIYQVNNQADFRFNNQGAWSRILTGNDSIYHFPSRRPDIRYRRYERTGFRSWFQHIAWVDSQLGDIYRFSSLGVDGTELTTVKGDVIFDGGMVHEKRSFQNLFEFECEPDSVNIWSARQLNGTNLTIEVSHDGLPVKTTPFAIREITGIHDVQQWWDSTGNALTGIGPDGALKLFESSLRIKEGSARSKLGMATLQNGTAFVANTSIDGNSRIVICNNGISGTVGELYTIKQNGIGFNIHSSSSADNSEVAWIIISAL